jgi:chromosome segregation ATPase
MTDIKSPISRVFGGVKPPNKLSEDDIHDEAVARALIGTKQLRDEIHHWRQRAEKAETDIFTMKHEFEAKISMARHDNDSLRKQNTDISAKMEHYQISLLKLKTKINDLEMFFKLELKRMVDSVNHSANGAINFCNGSANSITKFLDDFHEEIQKTEYAPNEKPKPTLEPISTVDQDRLEDLVSKLKPEKDNDSIQH